MCVLLPDMTEYGNIKRSIFFELTVKPNPYAVLNKQSVSKVWLYIYKQEIVITK